MGLSASFVWTSESVEVHDFAELVAFIAPPGGNPFLEVRLNGRCTGPDGRVIEVEGFCDSADGAVHRIRFMPARVGRHKVRVELGCRDQSLVWEGSFDAVPGYRRGQVQVDPEHPYHFVWTGTGEHYFWNGTTCYWIAGWKDPRFIDQAIERLAAMKVNRLRMTINSRHESGDRWREPLVRNSPQFSYRVDPWVSAKPADADHADPQFDVTRFNLAMWRRFEHVLRVAREHDMVVDVIFYTDGQDPGVDPFGKDQMGGQDEQRYYRYAIARLAAYSNVCWDVTNEWKLFRTESWVNQMGDLIHRTDPYGHLTSVHGHEDFPYRGRPWCDFAMFQRWDESGGYAPMLELRKEQAGTGRPMPQVNEEYGYEDHYPNWGNDGKVYPTRTANVLRRTAWGIYMAGCYQTTGERANQGTGAGEDTGGGWINGRGDEHMTMLRGYAHIVDFFASFDWWKCDPRPDLVEGGAMLIANPGRLYAAYLPHARPAVIRLGPGRYAATWYNCRTGQWIAMGTVEGGVWKTPACPDTGDWAVRLVRNGEPG